MPVSVAEFAKAAEESGILTADSLAEFLQGGDPDTDAAQLANRLVKAGRLTTFQAEHVYGGEAGSLVLGPYVVLELLGKGGMGCVYKAEHRRMRRVVALKVIARNAPQSTAVQRFEREVQAAARLEHPNIVTAHDAGEEAGTHYLVMQFVDGRNLSEVVKASGPQPVDRAIDWVLQAARGLAYAHGMGVIHRDIKPGNLLLDREGVVKILDMGLARLETLDADQEPLTGTGQIMGTVDYMAPEQAMDTRRADARSDIYSLGATLWYLLTGRPLFSGESVMSKVIAHQQQTPPTLSSIRGEIAPEVEAVFQRMVAKKPADRFDSMQEVIAALQSLPRAVTVAGSPSIPFRGGAVARFQRRTIGGLKPLHLAIGGGVAGAVLLIGLVMIALGGRRDAGPPVRGGAPAGGNTARPATRLDAGASAVDAKRPVRGPAEAVPIDWVTVGDPGNTAHTTGHGAVDDSFQIMKYEWTNSQYVDFLNAVDPDGTNPHSLYSDNMGSDARGGIRFMAGNPPGRKYAVRTNMGDKPVNFVTWFDAARVANWLHNRQGSGSTEMGAYTLENATSGNSPARNPDALVYIPTENQWYKAAFYKGGSTDAGYWNYATQSNTAPTVVTAHGTGDGTAGGIGNFANYNRGASWNVQDGNMTTVGTNGGLCAYGAFDMSGNVLEWTDSDGAAGSSRSFRGGTWNGGEFGVSASFRGSNMPSYQADNLGFRLARPVENGDSH